MLVKNTLNEDHDFFSWENFFLERFSPNIFLCKSFLSLYPFVLLINAV